MRIFASRGSLLELRMTESESFPTPPMSEADLQKFAEEMREQTQKRQQMRRALKSVMTPIFRRHGFTGTCPRFRRLKPDRYDLFMFDFCSGHDGFTIQLGQCAPDDIGYGDIGDAPLELPAYLALRPPESRRR